MSATLAVWQGNAAANTVLEQRGALSPGDSVIDSGGELVRRVFVSGSSGAAQAGRSVYKALSLMRI